MNPRPTGSTSPKANGDHNVTKEDPSNPVETRIEEVNKKESNLDWVHRHFGTRKEDMKQLCVTINHSCHEIPSQTF